MIRTVILGLALLCVTSVAQAQDAAPPAEDGIGPYHFGMDETALRATAPNAHWTVEAGENGETLLAHGPRIAIGGARLNASLVLADGALRLVVLTGRSSAACSDVVRGFVTELEPTYGAFSGPEPPWETGIATRVETTDAGSDLRIGENSEEGTSAASSTRIAGMVVDVAGRRGKDETACALRVTFAPVSALGRLPEDTALWAEIDRARPLNGPAPWRTRPNGRDFAAAYPHRALDDRMNGLGVVQCLVNADGSLRCALAKEAPAGAGFGAAALQIARALRFDTTGEGASAIGRRYRLSIPFSVTGGH